MTWYAFRAVRLGAKWSLPDQRPLSSDRQRYGGPWIEVKVKSSVRPRHERGEVRFEIDQHLVTIERGRRRLRSRAEPEVEVPILRLRRKRAHGRGPEARVEHHVDDGLLRIPVRAVSAKHVIVGRHAARKVRVHVVVRSVMLDLEHVEVHGAVLGKKPGSLEPVEDEVLLRIAREQKPLPVSPRP